MLVDEGFDCLGGETHGVLGIGGFFYSLFLFILVLAWGCEWHFGAFFVRFGIWAFLSHLSPSE